MDFGGLAAFMVLKLCQSSDKEFVQYLVYGQEGFIRFHQKKLNDNLDIIIEQGGLLECSYTEENKFGGQYLQLLELL